MQLQLHPQGVTSVFAIEISAQNSFTAITIRLLLFGGDLLHRALFISLVLSTAVASAVIPSLPANAQKQPPRPKGQFNPHPSTEFDSVPLKEAPPMPLLPQYTGKGMKFENAITMPNFKSSAVYTVLYSVKEPPDLVHEWYMQNLPSGGWVFPKQGATSETIMASLPAKGASVAIQVMGSSRPGFRTSLRIKYSVPR